MASGPGTGVAAPPAEHIAKGTIDDPALQSAIARAVATNDRASLTAMQPTITQLSSQLGQMQGALTPQGNLVSVPSIGAQLGTALSTLAPALAAAAAPQAPAIAPAAAQALQTLALQQQQQPLQQQQATVGRAVVQRSTAALDPQLEAIRSQLELQANQTQATSEHRTIEKRQAFQRTVLRRLANIEAAARVMRF